MLTIKKGDIADTLLLETMADMHVVKDKLGFFEKKYNMSYEVFEQTVKSQEEDYHRWDDYMEWKAYRRLFEDNTRKIRDIKNADFEVNSMTLTSLLHMKFWITSSGTGVFTTN
jgi:hypothetical protein